MRTCILVCKCLMSGIRFWKHIHRLTRFVVNRFFIAPQSRALHLSATTDLPLLLSFSPPLSFLPLHFLFLHLIVIISLSLSLSISLCLFLSLSLFRFLSLSLSISPSLSLFLSLYLSLSLGEKQSLGWRDATDANGEVVPSHLKQRFRETSAKNVREQWTPFLD